MITADAALEHIFALLRPGPIETVPLSEAVGRVMAQPVTARRAQPPFPASAMDGYAIGDVAPGATVAVVGTSQAGHGYLEPLPEGAAVRIFTGAPVPEGTRRVVIQEDVTLDGDHIRLPERFEDATHIRAAGQDFPAGFTLEAPRRLRPQDIALLAAMQADRVPVHARPVVALISTGDELVAPGSPARPDQIAASNAHGLAALLAPLGARVRHLPIAPDTPEGLGQLLDMAAGADLIVTIGGASVGDHDLVGRVATEKGWERSFYKIAMRPGKPLMAGRLGESVLIGLPGNPVSAMVCAHLFLRPALDALSGLPARPMPRARGHLARAVGPNGPREHFMRARLAWTDQGAALTPFERQDSALLTVLAEADALAIRPPNAPATEAGTPIDYILL